MAHLIAVQIENLDLFGKILTLCVICENKCYKRILSILKYIFPGVSPHRLLKLTIPIRKCMKGLSLSFIVTVVFCINEVLSMTCIYINYYTP